MNRFKFLIDIWPDLYSILEFSEENLYNDSNIVLIKLRQAVEITTKKILDYEGIYCEGELIDLVNELNNSEIINEYFGEELLDLFHEIRKYGNKAAHEGYSDVEKAEYFLEEMREVLLKLKQIMQCEEEQDSRSSKEEMCCSFQIGLGEADAINKKGILYGERRRVEQDYRNEYERYKKAADSGDILAKYNIGKLYEEGKGVERDYQKAYEWYKKAADLRFDLAMYSIGKLYEEGKGVEQNYKKAYNWHKKAADLGDASFMYYIGWKYFEGKVVEQDFSKVFEWCKKAADLGHDKAMIIVGLSYYAGKGVNKDYIKAYEWFKKAADLGNEDAISFLKRLNHI